MLSKNILKLSILTPFFLPAFAAANTIVVTPSAPAATGKLLITGTTSKDIKSDKSIDLKGKVTYSDKDLSGQNESYTACYFKRNASGVAIKQSSDQEESYSSDDDCTTGELNKPLELRAGSYYVSFNSSVATVDVNSSQTTKIDLIKIQVPQVKGVSSVNLYVDYTSAYEQNKYFFNLRINSANQDFVSGLPKTFFGRNYLMPFIDSGNYSDINSHARDIIFNAKAELCSINADGTIDNDDSDCNRASVGSWNAQGTRSTCVEHKSVHASIFGGIYSETDPNCKTVTVNYDWSRAYFLVLPGTYILQWNSSENGVISEKSVNAR